MKDTNKYGTAHSGRVQFGRQAALVSLLAPVLYGGLAVADLLIIRKLSAAAGAFVGFLACFLAIAGIGLGVAAHYGLRRKRHDRYRIAATLGIAAGLIFFAAFVVACVLIRRAGAS